MPGERVLFDSEERLQYARDVGWRLLERRDRTVVEVRQKLADKRVEPELIEQVVAELADTGYLDDARYAQRFAEDRRRLDSWGADRIERRLRTLGVESEHIERAVAGQTAEGEMEAALALLERRFPGQPATQRECERALGVLVRKGYSFELAHDALRRHAGFAELE